MKIKLRIMLSALLLTGASMTFADDKSALKVLYVGKNPEKVTFDNLMAYDKQSPFARRKVVLGKSRLPSFKAFLSKHFESVDVVYSADYSESMSDNYQVTIFGNVPRAVKEKVLEMDEKTGKVKRFEPPEYLSRDFDNAAILLAEVSPLIAEPLEYKMDWFCQCLDAHAHGMKLDHPIFNTPTRVALSVASRPTPESYRHYYNGRALPDALPMWRVQNEGYMDGKGYTIGMVSTGNGFADAPDAEVISNGVCMKSVDSVALARHGNFFHWGFSAAPDDMTEEGRQVFLNTVHYIARFNGEKPYSRRQFRKQTRDMAINAVHFAQQANYEQYAKKLMDDHKAQKSRLERKAEAGEKLSFAEKRRIKAEPPKPMSREAWMEQEILKRLPAELVAQFGTDLDKYMVYYQENFEYLMPAERENTFVVDNDVKALGVSNRQPELLERCIRLLEQGEDVDRARRLLARYTAENFSSAGQWRQWFDHNKGRLYFSDVGGYKFAVAP